jgi:putative transposase
MSRTVSPSSGRPYGLARVCRVWRASRASVYRHLSSRPEPPRRPGPVGPMPDAALVDAIRAVLTASPFHGEGHRKVWARLRVAGVRTSKRRVLRLMRENNLLAPSRVGAPRGPRTHDGTIIPETVDTMWGTVGHGPDHDHHRRGTGCGVRRCRSRLSRVCGHPCRAPGHPL